MPSCVFRKCTNYTASVKDTTGVSFHALPRNGVMRQKWVTVIRHQRMEYDWMPTHYTTVCSNHFERDDMYLTERNVRRLYKTAVPRIEATKEEHNMLLPSNLLTVNIEEVDPTKEEPYQTTNLQSKIRQMSLDKKKLKRRNNNLTRRNNRLSKKCNDLIRIVYKLKRKLAKYECDEK